MQFRYESPSQDGAPSGWYSGNSTCSKKQRKDLEVSMESSMILGGGGDTAIWVAFLLLLEDGKEKIGKALAENGKSSSVAGEFACAEVQDVCFQALTNHSVAYADRRRFIGMCALATRTATAYVVSEASGGLTESLLSTDIFLSSSRAHMAPEKPSVLHPRAL